MVEELSMKSKEKKLELKDSTIYQTNENCQVFNGPISGCVFAMPGATVNQSPVQQVTPTKTEEESERVKSEEAEVVEEVKEVAGQCGELLVNDVFNDDLFMTNERLLRLRTIIRESIGMGNREKIDLSKGLEWYWLYQAIYDAGLFETRSNRENVVTVVGFVRQIAKWLPDIIDIDDDERIRNICKSVSAEQGKWIMNGKPVNLVDIEANKRRMTAMKPAKIERIVSVAYNGLYTKLVALKQEILKEKATR